MAKRQTRRAISVKGLTYQRLQKYCEARGRSVSGYLEEIIKKDLDDKGWPEETTLEPRPPRPEPKSLGEFAGSSFTF